MSLVEAILVPVGAAPEIITIAASLAQISTALGGPSRIFGEVTWRSSVEMKSEASIPSRCVLWRRADVDQAGTGRMTFGYFPRIPELSKSVLVERDTPVEVCGPILITSAAFANFSLDPIPFRSTDRFRCLDLVHSWAEAQRS
jgi:hypothetical protein